MFIYLYLYVTVGENKVTILKFHETSSRRFQGTLNLVLREFRSGLHMKMTGRYFLCLWRRLYHIDRVMTMGMTIMLIDMIIMMMLMVRVKACIVIVIVLLSFAAAFEAALGKEITITVTVTFLAMTSTADLTEGRPSRG